MKLKKIIQPLYQPLLAIFFALIIGGIVISIYGENPLEIYSLMISRAFGNKYYLLTTLNRATPIIICGLGAAIAWKSNYMGIGGEGQMIFGGFISAIVAVYCPGSGFVKIVVAILCSILFGALYSIFSAWLLDKFDMSLAISTLMLNYIAQYVTYHYVSNVFTDPLSDVKATQTVLIDEVARLPQIFTGYSLHLGFIFATLLCIFMWFLMYKTNFGYESRMTGLNKNFCDYGGISSKKIMYTTLAISGALCAFAGTSEVLGVNYRYISDSFVSGSFAWIGLNSALISAYNPIGIFITSIVLAGVQTGGSAIARATAVPEEISSVIQGCITLFISAKIIINFTKSKKSKKGDI